MSANARGEVFNSYECVCNGLQMGMHSFAHISDVATEEFERHQLNFSLFSQIHSHHGEDCRNHREKEKKKFTIQNDGWTWPETFIIIFPERDLLA